MLFCIVLLFRPHQRCAWQRCAARGADLRWRFRTGDKEVGAAWWAHGVVVAHGGHGDHDVLG